MKKQVSKFLTKIFICIIIALITLILSNQNDTFKKQIQKYVFTDSFDFMKFKNWYSSLSNYQEKSKLVKVSNESSNYEKKEKYFDGEKYFINSLIPLNSLSSGIIVFIGNKENYGNTIIVQGSDGYDIWYGNIEDSNLKMYDYIEKDSILGNVNKEYTLVITKDKKYYTYEEYIQNK